MWLFLEPLPEDDECRPESPGPRGRIVPLGSDISSGIFVSTRAQLFFTVI
jgi:hypothetical protein